MVDFYLILLIFGLIKISFYMNHSESFQKLLTIALGFSPYFFINFNEPKSVVVLAISNFLVLIKVLQNGSKNNFHDLFGMAILPTLVTITISEQRLMNFLILLFAISIVLYRYGSRSDIGLKSLISLSSTAFSLFICLLYTSYLGIEYFKDLELRGSTFIAGVIVIVSLKICGFFEFNHLIREKIKPIDLNLYKVFVSFLLLNLIVFLKMSLFFNEIINLSSFIYPAIVLLCIWGLNYSNSLKSSRGLTSKSILVGNSFLLFFSSLYLNEKGFYPYLLISIVQIGLYQILLTKPQLKGFRYLYLGFPLSPLFLYSVYCLSQINVSHGIWVRIPVLLVIFLPLIFYTVFLNEDID